MQVINRSSPIRLTDRLWWYLAFSLLVTLPLALVLVFFNPIYDWYLANVVAPELEHALGFTGGEVIVTDGNSAYDWYGITKVMPGGVFDRAGVKPGDMPVGYVHGVRSGFIGRLHESRGHTVALRFVTQHRDSNGKWSVKTVSVAVPAKRAG